MARNQEMLILHVTLWSLSMLWVANRFSSVPVDCGELRSWTMRGWFIDGVKPCSVSCVKVHEGNAQSNRAIVILYTSLLRFGDHIPVGRPRDERLYYVRVL